VWFFCGLGVVDWVVIVVWGFCRFLGFIFGGREQTTAKATAIDKSLRLRLRSGLRQSGDRIAVFF